MNIILLEKVRNLGKLGDKVNVRSGYARNFLIPQGKAVFATAKNLEAFQARRAELEQAEQEKLDQAKARAERLAEMNIELVVRAGDEGKLFGSLGTADIAHAFEKQGVEVLKREIRLSDGPIRFVGEHIITIHLHSDLNLDVKVTVVAE